MLINNSKVLVLGSNSFSGASFCSHLLKKDYQVYAVSRSDEPIGALLPYKWLSPSQQRALKYFKYDINHDLDSIIKLISSEGVKVIYNFAAQSMVGQSWHYPEHWFYTNAVSTIKFHNRLRDLDIERYVHISTPEVYGSCEGLVKENRTYFPSTPYAVSRAASDMSLHTFSDVYDFPVVFTRAANVFGEGQQLYRIIPRTILYILLNKKLPLHGGGHSTRSFIHIDDVSVATEKIGLNGKLGDIYHISTDRMISIRDVVELICKMMNRQIEDVCEISEDRPGKDAAYLLDATKLKTTLDWQSSVSLESGIERTISWVSENLEALKQAPFEYIHKP